MKIEPERAPDEALVDALLRDEEWQAASAEIKSRALGTFRARQRARRLGRWTLGGAVCAALITGAAHWFGSTTASKPTAAVPHPQAPARVADVTYITDKELLASFPKGSCFLAEVDGKKELIFVDPNVEREYIARPHRASE